MRVEARDKNENGVSTCLETPLWALDSDAKAAQKIAIGLLL